MKLTVSNTAMMKPLLHMYNQPVRTSPPQRVVGLLEISQAEHNQCIGLQKQVQYTRPDNQHASLQTALWQDFLQLINVKKVSCVAVFGFVFDGTRAWYQVWNCTTDRAYWLQHNRFMNYDAFAILTMDALVSLLPKWDGTLHQAPVATNDDNVAYQKSETIDAEQIKTLLVSDASTSAAGQLWFLVTINSTRVDNDNDRETTSNMLPKRSGWISSYFKGK